MQLLGTYAVGVITNYHLGYDGYQCGVAVLASDTIWVNLFLEENLAGNEYACGHALASQVLAQAYDGPPSLLFFYDSVNRTTGRFRMNMGTPLLAGMGGHRAAGIVRDMVLHSHQRTSERHPTNRNTFVEEALRLAYHDLQTKYASFAVKTETELTPALPPLVVPQDISRVLLNLLTNAFYAVRERQQRGEPGYVPTAQVHTRLVGSEAVILVHDNGLGVPEELKTKIFQLFFTTKPTGEGTGLGLSLSYDIVTQGHGGLLTPESTPGPGTTFRLMLPGAPGRGAACG